MTVDVNRATEVVPDALRLRPLLDDREVDGLSALFRALANDTRLRLLHAIARAGEASVGELTEAVGARTQAVSNQLQRLSDQQIVAARRDGNRVYYRLVDPCVGGLMELGLCLLAAHGPTDDGTTG